MYMWQKSDALPCRGSPSWSVTSHVLKQNERVFMKDQWYNQCLMKKDDVYRVGWIPSEFAQEGRILKLKLDNKWSNGWKVMQTGIIIDAQYAKAREMDYAKQRKASDI